jgi:hypothetical protein
MWRRRNEGQWSRFRRIAADQPAVAKLFEAMCRPVEDASDGKVGLNRGGRQSQAVQQEGRGELHVGIEPAIRRALTRGAQAPVRAEMTIGPRGHDDACPNNVEALRPWSQTVLR